MKEGNYYGTYTMETKEYFRRTDMLFLWSTWFEDYLLTEKFGKWAPAVDIEEKDGTYMVKADLPGLKKGDIHLELNDMPPFFINLAEKNQD